MTPLLKLLVLAATALALELLPKQEPARDVTPKKPLAPGRKAGDNQDTDKPAKPAEQVE